MNEITKEQISSTNHTLYTAFWKLFEASFPLSERRVAKQQKIILNHPKYRLQAWKINNQLLGFIGWWNFEQFRYLEHFAIMEAHPFTRAWEKSAPGVAQ
jgi:hypothetical protein